MPFLAAIPAWVGTAAALTGAAVTGVSAIASGEPQSEAYKAQGDAARYNQGVARQSGEAAEANARATEKARDVWEEAQRKKQLQLRGSQAAGYGAAGVILEGTPLDMLAFTAGEQEKEILAGRYNYDVEAANYRNQASRFSSQADFYGFEGERQDNLAGYPVGRGIMGAGTTLLTTMGNLAGGGVKYKNLTVPWYSSYKNSY